MKDRNGHFSSGEKVANCPPENINYVATIGSFDGVHRGHQCLLSQVRHIADERGLKAMAVTFAHSPKKVLGCGDMTLLSCMDERLTLLCQAGMDKVTVLDFTREMAEMSARDFMQQVLKEQLDVTVLVIGYDHRFGRGRTDGFDDFVQYGHEIGIEVVRGEACIDGEEPISSTRIRQDLAKGKVAEAAQLLGYNYTLCGKVVDGYREGRKMGFPTANLSDIDASKLIPADGVYAVRVYVNSNGDEEKNERTCRHKGMLNIGYRPTLNNGKERSIEVHILDFEGNLYGQSLCIEFIERIREERTFNNVNELIAQLHADRLIVEQML